MSDDFFTWLESYSALEITETLRSINSSITARLYNKVIVLESIQNGNEYTFKSPDDNFIMQVGGNQETDATSPSHILCGKIDISIPGKLESFELVYSAEIGNSAGRFYWVPLNGTVLIDIVERAKQLAQEMANNTIEELKSAGLTFDSIPR